MAETFFDSDVRVSGELKAGKATLSGELKAAAIKIGEAKAAKMTVSDSAPTTSTKGEVGDMILYVNSTTYKLYCCVKVSGSTYTWASATLT